MSACIHVDSVLQDAESDWQKRIWPGASAAAPPKWSVHTVHPSHVHSAALTWHGGTGGLHAAASLWEHGEPLHGANSTVY